LSNLSNLLREQGNAERAVATARQAVALKPDYAGAQNNLGLALFHAKNTAEALAWFERALALEPNSADFHCNRGATLASSGRLEEAEADLRQAIALRPGFEAATCQLSRVLSRKGQFDEAEALIRGLATQAPEAADVHRALGEILMRRCASGEANYKDRACAEFDRAIELKPDLAQAHLARAMLWLTLGDFERGWPEYEWRWQCRDLGFLPLLGTPWDGSALEGRELLVRCEQGIGDLIQFVRYAVELERRGATVVLCCPESIVPLLRRTAGIARFVSTDTPLPEPALSVSLLSAPGLLKTTEATIPGECPYIHPDTALVEKWRNDLSDLTGYRIGIAWQGNPQHSEDRLRSIPLTRFEPIARVPGVRLISLQVGLGTEQIGALAGRFAVHDLGAALEQAPGAFMDAAAVMRNLDLVISCDTAIAHLAGALAVPVWVALPFAPDWRWQFGREDSPWYPSMRLFRQKKPLDWEEVFGRMAREIASSTPH
jgi:tetratricopeptide (TPR) repeat protein